MVMVMVVVGMMNDTTDNNSKLIEIGNDNIYEESVEKNE